MHITIVGAGYVGLVTGVCLSRKGQNSFIMTEWEEIKAYRPKQYVQYMNTPIVTDGRNCYPTKIFAGSGVLYDSIGRRTVNDDIVDGV
ncbi:MAG TPA: hypothetical protein VN441_08995 [Syntrophomonas sp.]|nr:hypothetical protein [Syntrophomonas sp.]